MEQFRSQEDAYKQALLPNHITKIAIEAAASQPWYEWVGSNG
jgi:transketolase